MGISYARNTVWSCTACGSSHQGPEWVVIDAVERPDLLRAISERDLLQRVCPDRNEAVGPQAALLLTRLSDVAPLLLGIDRLEPGRAEQAIADAGPLFDRTQVELGEALVDVPGPALPVGLDALIAAIGRDVQADLDASPPVADVPISYLDLLERVGASAEERRCSRIVNHLAGVRDFAGYRAFLDAFPDATSSAVQAVLETDETDQSRAAGFRSLSQAWRQLLATTAEVGADEAWPQHESAIRELLLEHFAPEIDGLVATLTAARGQGDADQIIEASRALLARASQAELLELEALAAMELAQALATKRPGEHLEEIVVLFERVLAIAEQLGAVPWPQSAHVSVLSSLGALYSMRTEGDLSANRARSIALQEEALELVSFEDEPETWALLNTNLGLTLAQGASSDDEQAKAIQHLIAATRWRSFERNPEDWAYTQMNIGVAHASRRTGRRDFHLRLAVNATIEALRGGRAAQNDLLISSAEHNLLTFKADLGRIAVTPAEQRRYFREAQRHAEEALALGGTRTRVEEGNTFLQLARLRHMQGDVNGAASAFRSSLADIDPREAPHHYRDAGEYFAALAEDIGDHELAADAWSHAIEGTRYTYASRATVQGRLEELSTDARILRFSAHALARAGRYEQAIETLELGRARELLAISRVDALDAETLAYFDPALSERFTYARARLEEVEAAGRALGQPSRDAESVASNFRDVLAAVEELPGFEGVFQPLTFDRIADAAKTDRPLAYLVCAPTGSCALIIWSDAEDGRRIEFVHSPDYSSAELVVEILGIDTVGNRIRRHSYLRAQAANEHHDLDEALDGLAMGVGLGLLKPLSEALDAGGASGVCLVASGLLGLVPLHAITFGEEAACLLDLLEVDFAPSAAIRLACQTRQRDTDARPIRLVAVADPSTDHADGLPGAVDEVEGIVRLFSQAEVLEGSAATKERVVGAISDATYLHFACHGVADFDDKPYSAELLLAGDDVLSTAEIMELDIQASLVVASACQSGVIQNYNAVDETLCISSAFLAAGAHAVVSTLWAIDDFATSLLMTEFYRRHLAERVPASSALRDSQQWLRRITDQDIDEYLRDKPRLAVRRTRRFGAPARPFSDPEVWAAFIYTGA